MFFVVTTGRSGSQTMAQVLSQHPLCHCLHEPHLILTKLATERCHDQIDDAELRQLLFNQYNPYEMFPHRRGLKLYGESDQKLSYIIPTLAELGTTVRFIWLIRDGRDVVASTFSRGWYDSEETSNPPHIWAKHRIQGHLCGDVCPETWSTLSPFEKCCWYWSFTNRTVEKDLQNLDPASWIMLRIEDLAARLNDLLDFLELPYYPLRVVRANRSSGPTHHFEKWNKQQRAAFDFWCGEEMDRLYPDWRDGEKSPYTSESGYGRNRLIDVVHTVSSHARWLTVRAVRRVASVFSYSSGASS